MEIKWKSKYEIGDKKWCTIHGGTKILHRKIVDIYICSDHIPTHKRKRFRTVELKELPVIYELENLAGEMKEYQLFNSKQELLETLTEEQLKEILIDLKRQTEVESLNRMKLIEIITNTDDVRW
jgi:CBS-domain-containing membrane protein